MDKGFILMGDLLLELSRYQNNSRLELGSVMAVFQPVYRGMWMSNVFTPTVVY